MYQKIFGEEKPIEPVIDTVENPIEMNEEPVENMGETKKFAIPTEEQVAKATKELKFEYGEEDQEEPQELNNLNEIKEETIQTNGIDLSAIVNEEINQYKAVELSEEEVPQSLRKENQRPPINFDEMYTKTFGSKSSMLEVPEDEVLETELANKNYKFIGIVFSTYIIIEVKEEMYLIDQHAAHERILYEKVKSNFYSDSNKDSQLMLIPDVINLTHKEMDIANDHLDMFEKAGFVMENFGDNSIKLIGVPTVCIELNTKELFLEILDEIDSVARTAKQEIEERFISTVACKAAVKAKMKLTKEEVDSLMEQILKLPNPFTCPHGRPTAIKIRKYEIERKFSRK